MPAAYDRLSAYAKRIRPQTIFHTRPQVRSEQLAYTTPARTNVRQHQMLIPPKILRILKGSALKQGPGQKPGKNIAERMPQA